jgi:thymidylate kinase
MKTRIISVLGIDGAGKSSVSELLLHSPGFRDYSFSILTCPDYHLMHGKPYEKLSFSLHHLNALADKYGHSELKASALYLHMTLFGPVEQLLISNSKPDFIITERHAIVDTLAYGIFYSTLVQQKKKQPVDASVILEELQLLYPGAMNEILQWLRAENKRLGRDLEFTALPAAISQLFNLGPRELVSEFSRHYQTGLPDMIIFIDIAPAMAIARLEQSGAILELHEQKGVMETLRASYLKIFGFFESHFPDVKIIRIDGEDAGNEYNLTQQIVQSLLQFQGTTI